MKIEDIDGKHVKASANTITVKGDNGKTCGLVRAARLDELQFNKQIQFLHCLPKNIRQKDVYIVGNSMYFLFNLRTYDYLYDDEKKAYEEKADSFSKIGTVIKCFVH